MNYEKGTLARNGRYRAIKFDFCLPSFIHLVREAEEK